MSDDLVKTARRAKGSAVLPTVSFGILNAEQLILRMADRIEELEAKLAKAVEAGHALNDALREKERGKYLTTAQVLAAEKARTTLAELKGQNNE